VKRKTPQEKKKLSYAKDRRNTVAESKSSARKSIRARRAIENRRYRRALNEKLGAEFETSVPARAAKLRKSGWKKIADAPLGDVVKDNVQSRAILKNMTSRQRRNRSR
jgi:hypothetical protein